MFLELIDYLLLLVEDVLDSVVYGLSSSGLTTLLSTPSIEWTVRSTASIFTKALLFPGKRDPEFEYQEFDSCGYTSIAPYDAFDTIRYRTHR